MSGDEHVVSLDRGADKETRQWNNWESEPFREVLVNECVGIVVF